jgi:hypothetical protein
MDKAEITFEKIAGPWTAITRAFGKLNFLKKKMPDPLKPYTGKVKIETPKLKRIENMPGSDALKAQQEFKKTFTGGKRGVSILNPEELARRVAADRHLRNMGMS